MLTRRKKWLRIAGGLLFLLLALVVSHEVLRLTSNDPQKASLWRKLRGTANAADWRMRWEIMTGQRVPVVIVTHRDGAKMERDFWPPAGPPPAFITLPPIPKGP
jgi:hypothetical protein